MQKEFIINFRNVEDVVGGTEAFDKVNGGAGSVVRLFEMFESIRRSLLQMKRLLKVDLISVITWEYR